MSKIVSDRISFSDTGVPISPVNPGLWAWTEVIGGYGDIIHNPRGKSTIGEECFRTHNIVPISGVSTVMSKLFEVQEVGEGTITYPTLFGKHQIGAKDGDIGNGPSYQIPNISRKDGTGNLTVTKNMVFPAGHGIIGFCVGNTGTAESDISIYKPEYNDCDMTLSSKTVSGKEITSTIIPFRYTAEDLNPLDKAKYFGKKKNPENQLTGYYLKRFENDPVIKHVWIDGTEIDEDTEESLVTNADLWNTNIGGVNTIASFTEITLKISKKDIKEWFNVMEEEDRARINTIALYSGDFVAGYNPSNPDEPDTSTYVGDYRNCRLFSKLIINPEYLNIAKDLSIIYRVYGS